MVRDRLRRLRDKWGERSPAVADSTSQPTTKATPAPPTPLVARPSSPSSNPSPGPGSRPARQTVAVSRDFLDRVLELLPQRDRATIEEHSLTTTDDIDSTLEGALIAAQYKRKLCEDKRWTFVVRGRTVKLLDEADNVMLWLDRFKQVGDVAMRANPIHASIPWVGIRLLLEVRRDSDTLLIVNHLLLSNY